MRLKRHVACRLQNTFHTLKDMRIVFVDGTVLDTANAIRRVCFVLSEKLCALESDARNAALTSSSV